MKPLISPSELLDLQNEPHLILIDTRSGADAREKYQTEHLQGAHWVDLEAELSEKSADAAQGGRHPLPPVEKFAQLLGRLGVTPASHVIAYDDKNGAMSSARFWWMLRALGHEKIQVLNGGYQAAVNAGFPTSSEQPKPEPQPTYPADHWQLPMADIEEVAEAAQAKDAVVIDVRAPRRYAGKHEPIDLVAGHIPGAINIPFVSNLGADGSFLPPKQLAKKYNEAIGKYNADNIIVHCGSGVTACHTLLAIAQAGLEIPKLYVGSWSEWSRRERPIAKEE
jgi:thiosulfate/3-mercaptopyruvate sulfurtransferase